MDKSRQPITWLVMASLAFLVILGGVAVAIVASQQSIDRETDPPPAVEFPDETPPETDNSPQLFTAAEIAHRLGDSVLRIEGSGCGYESVGSGFVIGDGIILTNWHVVSNDVEPEVVSRTGERYRSRVVGWSESPDVAVLEVEGLSAAPLNWRDAAELSEGDEIVVLGYPLPANEFTVLTGSIVSFVMAGHTREAIRTDAALDYGNSGGPALTLGGDVAGVVTQGEFGGLQFVPVVFTWESLESSVQQILRDRSFPEVNCQSAVAFSSGQESAPAPSSTTTNPPSPGDTGESRYAQPQSPASSSTTTNPPSPGIDFNALWGSPTSPEDGGPAQSICQLDMGPIDPDNPEYGELYNSGADWESPYDGYGGSDRSWDQAYAHGLVPTDDGAYYSDQGFAWIEGEDPRYNGWYSVLFFYDGRYLGRDTCDLSNDLNVAWGDRDLQTLGVMYGLYGPGDGSCCPSVYYEVQYTWDGATVVPNKLIPPSSLDIPYNRSGP